MAKVGLVGFGGIGIDIAKILVLDPDMTYDIVAFDRKEAIEQVPGPLKGNYEDILDALGMVEAAAVGVPIVPTPAIIPAMAAFTRSFLTFEFISISFLRNRCSSNFSLIF